MFFYLFVFLDRKYFYFILKIQLIALSKQIGLSSERVLFLRKTKHKLKLRSNERRIAKIYFKSDKQNILSFSLN